MDPTHVDLSASTGAALQPQPVSFPHSSLLTYYAKSTPPGRGEKETLQQTTYLFPSLSRPKEAKKRPPQNVNQTAQPGMAMEVDEDDVWGAVATSPSASPPPPPAISTALSLHLLAASGGIVGGVAASPSSSYLSAAAASSSPRLAPLDAGPSAAAASWTIANAGGGGGGGPVERHKRRLMKNRESASRSRARRQAHVTQIETELEELREANEQLRLKYEQLKATVEKSVPVPVKKTLKRVLSAPF